MFKKDPKPICHPSDTLYKCTFTKLQYVHRNKHIQNTQDFFEKEMIGCLCLPLLAFTTKARILCLDSL
jgi:hypothetical protein